MIYKVEHALAEFTIKGHRPKHSGVDSIESYTQELEALNRDIADRISAIEVKQRPKLDEIKASATRTLIETATGENDDNDENGRLLTKQQSSAASEAESSSSLPADGIFVSNSEHDTRPTSSNARGRKATTVANAAKKTANKISKKRAREARQLFNTAGNVAESVLGTAAEGSADDAAFVTFNSLVAVQAALQMSQHTDPFIFDCFTAPDEPRYLLWGNIGKDKEAIQSGRVLSATATVALCLFWTIPVAALASFTTVGELTCRFPSLDNYAWIAPMLRWASPLVLLIFNTALLPIVLKLVSRLEFPPSDSLLEASAFWKMAAFHIIQTFLYVSLCSCRVL